MQEPNDPRYKLAVMGKTRILGNHGPSRIHLADYPAGSPMAQSQMGGTMNEATESKLVILSDPRPVILWDCDDGAEVLNHHTRNEALEAHLDGADIWDGTIQVYGYARMVVPKPSESDAVDLINEWYDTRWEELQGEERFDAPDSTIDAALAFLTVLHEEFVPWACEVITTEEVDVAAWIAENHPEWESE